MSISDRNLGPAGALGTAGEGAPTLPLLFSAYTRHDVDHPMSPALAIARVGGMGGQIFVYSPEAMGRDYQSCATFAGGGRSWDTLDEPPRSLRDSLASYLLSPLSQSPSSHSSSPPLHSIPHSRPINLPLTPPSSISPDRHIVAASVPIRSIPLTPTSSRGSDAKPSSLPGSLPTSTPLNCTIVPLIADLFPYHAPAISESAQTIEIVTPPNQILHGFTHDGPAGRTVYIHLQPHLAPAPPEHLSANFSDVLRPHDPQRPLGQSAPSSSPGQALDIRESLTALLDLAGDPLEASGLILILDRDDREPERLAELLHALMYVGGQVVRPGALSGGWQWDPTRWVLVGMEV